MGNDSNDKKALIALMDLVLALADYVTTPPGHRSDVVERVRAERREVAGWRETLHLLSTEVNREALEASIRQAWVRADSRDGQAARTAVAATERRYDRMWGLRREMDKSVVDLGANREPIEADDSRITDGHKCCGGKPDCGCARSVGG